MTGTTFIPLLIVIIIIAKTKKIINKFIESGATAIFSAKTPEELAINRNAIFRRLVRKNILVEVSDRYFIDEQKLLEHNIRRRKIMAIVIILIFVIILTEFIVFNYLKLYTIM